MKNLTPTKLIIIRSFESSRDRERVTMSLETATDQDSRTKRAKTDLNVAPLEKSSASRTPKSQAQDFISSHVESLHFHIATILKKIGFDHINLIHKLLNKIKQKTKMELDQSLIPRSARLDFTLKSSKKVEELPDYIQLKEDTEIYLRTVKENLKARILVATSLEIKSLRQEILEHFVKGSFLIAKTLKIGEGEPDANIHGIISEIIHERHESFLPHFDTDLTIFKELYKTLLDVATFPDIAPAPSQQLVVVSPHFATNAARPAPTITPMSSATATIARTIECLFITSIERYSEQEKKNEININLKKLDINHLTEPATAEAEMEVGNELSVTPENLKELVAKETKLATAALLKELNSLKSKFNKNTPALKGSGARTQSRGASPKKSKKTKKNGKKVSFAASAAPPADDAASATSAKKRNNRSDSSKKKKGKKGKQSRTEKNK